MRRILVTGASGFIGRHVVAMLTGRQNAVHAVSSGLHSECSGVIWHRVDLMQSRQVAELIERVRPTDLLHLAWVTKHGEYWESRENVQWVEHTLGLLRQFYERGGRRAVFAGTCAEYDWSFGYCREAVTPCRPRTFYGKCKDGLRRLVDAFAEQADLSIAWGRVFFLYGPGEQPKRLVPYVIRQVSRGDVAQCSSGEQIRDFLHVADVASAFIELLDSDVTGPVNIASGVPVTVAEVAIRIGELLGRPGLVQLGARADESASIPLLMGDVTRLRREVGWRPRYTLETGLADTIRWWADGSEEVVP